MKLKLEAKLPNSTLGIFCAVLSCFGFCCSKMEKKGEETKRDCSEMWFLNSSHFFSIKIFIFFKTNIILYDC